MAEILIEHGARADVGNKTGETPLHYASVAGNLEVARCLIDAGADVDRADDFGKRPLHDAAAAGHAALVELLIQRGAQVDGTDGQGMTALHWAAARGTDRRFRGGLGLDLPPNITVGSQHPRVIELLIEAGADVNARDRKRRTPLKLATKGKHKDLTGILQ